MSPYTISDFRRDMRLGEFAWPGGYQRYFIMSDGEALSFEAARENRRTIIESIAREINDGWRVVGAEINWEDPELYCAHTGERIPSAYAED